MSEIRITRVDPTDETALLEWNDLMRLGYTESRTGVWWRSAETTLAQFARPRADRRDIPLIACLGETVIGGAEINLSTEAANNIELTVLPAHRRRRFGTSLAEAVEDLIRA